MSAGVVVRYAFLVHTQSGQLRGAAKGNRGGSQ